MYFYAIISYANEASPLPIKTNANHCNEVGISSWRALAA